MSYIDAERHYVEPDDCFTRHLERKFADRAVHVVRKADGTGTWYFGDTPLTKARKAVSRILLPGSYGAIARDEDEDVDPLATIDAFLPEFTLRSRFLEVMDEQHVEAALVMPAHVLNIPYDLRDDPVAAHANVRAFNRWVEEEWGFAYENRIFATPLLALFDVELATAELQRVLDAGARAIVLNTGPVAGRSPGDRLFDPFWALLHEARAFVCFHIDYFGYHDFFSSAWGELAAPVSEAQVNAFQWLTCAGMRPMMDMTASLVMHNVFGRFPNVNILSVSNGSAWIKDLARLDSFASPDFPWPRDDAVWWPGGRLPALPSELIRQHLYVAPFVWDDMTEILGYVSADRVVMATDYPHPDGFAVAEDYRRLLTKVGPEVERRITHDNLGSLLLS